MGHDQAPSVRAGNVEIAGAFDAAEREFLAAQFGRCRFELLARSAHEPKVALVAWSAAPAGIARGGPSPLFAPPQQATYVLDGTGGSATSGGPGAAATAGGMALVRVESSADLEARYRGHFPGVRLQVSWWQKVRRLWPGALPGIMVAGFAVWLAAVAQTCRAAG